MRILSYDPESPNPRLRFPNSYAQLPLPWLFRRAHRGSFQVARDPPAGLAGQGDSSGRLFSAFGGAFDCGGVTTGAYQKLVVAVGRDQHEGFCSTVFLYPTTSHEPPFRRGPSAVPYRPARVAMYGFRWEGANALVAPPGTPLPVLLAEPYYCASPPASSGNLCIREYGLRSSSPVGRSWAPALEVRLRPLPLPRICLHLRPPSSRTRGTPA